MKAPVKIGSPEFLRLQREAYAKLRAEGFHDIEPCADGLLSTGHSQFQDDKGDARAHGGTARAEQLAAIEDASQALLRRKHWPTPLHKRVWEMHCQGLCTNKIRDALKCRRQKVLDAYLWCCVEAGVPTGAYGGVGLSRRGDRRDSGDRRRIRRNDCAVRAIKRLGLRELLSVLENARVNDE